MQNVQSQLLLVEEDIDMTVDIRYQEYDRLDYAKRNVIDCKPTEEEILEELLNNKKKPIWIKIKVKYFSFTDIIRLIC
jgi:hypothetical protein